MLTVDAPSVAVTVKLIEPAVVGVPLMVAVVPFGVKDKPPGQPAPGVSIHVQQSNGRKPFAVSV